MYAKLFRNMITNGKSHTLLSDFFFSESGRLYTGYQKVKHHNINVSSTKVWSLTNKGWKAFKRKKIPQSSEKQRRARLNFSRKYSKFTAEDWENFLFTDKCRKYLVRYPNPENHIVWGSQECDVPPAYQLKQTTTATATKTSLQNITLSYSKYFMIIPFCLYYTIWAKCPINGLIWTDLK